MAVILTNLMSGEITSVNYDGRAFFGVCVS